MSRHAALPLRLLLRTRGCLCAIQAGNGDVEPRMPYTVVLNCAITSIQLLELIVGHKQRDPHRWIVIPKLIILIQHYAVEFSCINVRRLWTGAANEKIADHSSRLFD